MMRIRFASAQLKDGPRLHYAEQGDPGGRPILFLHGWPHSCFSFSRVLPFLPLSLHAFALDQRGFGESEKPDSDYGIDQFAADAVAFLDAMSIPQASVVGHSFGSFVTRRVALNYPERVDRMVLIGTSAAGSNSVTREVRKERQVLDESVPEAFARSFQS